MTAVAMVRPTIGSVMRTGLPGFLREGLLPLLGFYVGQGVGGLSVGLAAGTAIAIVEYAVSRRAGREGLLVRLTLAFIVVQGAVAWLANSAIVYLAAPLLMLIVWAAAFLGSTFTPRPLAGVLACAWYPFPEAYRRSDVFVRVFRLQSVVWGLIFVARAAVRVAFLAGGAEVGDYVVVATLTGLPLTFVVLVWSIRHAIVHLPAPDALPTEPAVPSN